MLVITDAYGAGPASLVCSSVVPICSVLNGLTLASLSLSLTPCDMLYSSLYYIMPYGEGMYPHISSPSVSCGFVVA